MNYDHMDPCHVPFTSRLLNIQTSIFYSSSLHFLSGLSKLYPRSHALVITKVVKALDDRSFIRRPKTMTGLDWRPLHSSLPSSDRDLLIPRSTPSSLRPRQIQYSTGSSMPATLDFSRSPSSGYCYGLVNRDSELMTDPRFLSSWYDTEAASNSCRLPRLPSSTYGNPSEVFQDPVDRSAVDGDERPSLPWAAESSHELAPPSYLPNTPGSCSYAGLHSIEGGNQQWNVPSYSFGYPTPQSDLSLSPPQHIHRVFPLDSPDDNIRRNGLHTASDRADAQEEFKGLAAAGRQFSHNPRLTSSEQAQFPYGQGRDDQEPPDLNEVIDEDGNVDSEPYAQLIFRALKSAPGHRMVLKDIYQWFEKYTNKATGNSKGWQNSIRHNLSMNGVRFLPVPSCDRVLQKS